MASLHINGVTYELQAQVLPASKELNDVEAQLLRAEDPSGQPQHIGIVLDGSNADLRLLPGRVWAWAVQPDIG